MGLAGADTTTNKRATSSALTPWGWPLGSLGLSAYTPRGVVFELLGEAGYVVLPVTAGTPVLRGPVVQHPAGDWTHPVTEGPAPVHSAGGGSGSVGNEPMIPRWPAKRRSGSAGPISEPFPQAPRTG